MWKKTGRKDGFDKMSPQDTFFVADRSQVYPAVPSQKKGEVDGESLSLFLREGRLPKRAEHLLKSVFNVRQTSRSQDQGFNARGELKSRPSLASKSSPFPRLASGSACGDDEPSTGPSA